MTEVLKITGPQATIGTSPSSVSNCTVIRVLNIDPGYVLVTVANNGANVGEITIAPNEGEYIRKYADDTIVSNSAANCIGTPIAFTN
jgi:hypothetical protein